jgi:NAD(P)-dependent dehydrogenase (short-subunit alcohol dehydrogenase family)
VNYREQASDAEAVVAKIKSSGGRAIAVAADVSKAAAVATMVEQVASAYRPRTRDEQTLRLFDFLRRAPDDVHIELQGFWGLEVAKEIDQQRLKLDAVVLVRSTREAQNARGIA